MDIVAFLIIGFMPMTIIVFILESVWRHYKAKNLAHYYTSQDQDQITSYWKRYFHSHKHKKVTREEYLKNYRNNWENERKYDEYNT